MSITNQIGSYQFIDLAGNPQDVRRAIGLLARPGVPGVTLVDDAERGTPFVLRSKVDCLDFADCRARYRQYLALIGADPVNLVWQDLSYADDSLLVAVLDVQLAVMKPLAFGSSGGLNPPSLGGL